MACITLYLVYILTLLFSLNFGEVLEKGYVSDWEPLHGCYQIPERNKGESVDYGSLFQKDFSPSWQGRQMMEWTSNGSLRCWPIRIVTDVSF